MRCRRAAVPGARPRPRPSGHPPRHQAGERPDLRPWRGQGGGLRRRAARGRQQRCVRGDDRRDAAVHGARAGTRSQRERGDRRLQRRRGAVRDAGRQAPVQRRVACRAGALPSSGSTAAARAQHPGWARSGARPGAREGACRPLRDSRRDGERARAGACRGGRGRRLRPALLRRTGVPRRGLRIRRRGLRRGCLRAAM